MVRVVSNIRPGDSMDLSQKIELAVGILAGRQWAFIYKTRVLEVEAPSLFIFV
jgi:hypothetical protein